MISLIGRLRQKKSRGNAFSPRIFFYASFPLFKKRQVRKNAGFTPLEKTVDLNGVEGLALRNAASNSVRVKGRNSLTGFTFIELILVAVVILVLLGMATPLFRGAFTGVQLQDSCQYLVQLMRYTQAKSIAERRIYRVNFDFGKGTFWLTVQDSQDNKKFSRITGRWAKVHQLPQGITIQGEDAILTFYPDGTADKESITLSDQRDNGFTITAKRRIGYVQIEK